MVDVDDMAWLDAGVDVLNDLVVDGEEEVTVEVQGDETAGRWTKMDLGKNVHGLCKNLEFIVIKKKNEEIIFASDVLDGFPCGFPEWFLVRHIRCVCSA